ncbi:PAS domain S-box-containing protein/diguanylate cyclase (GGDEF) domain-containing protein [Paenibacillus sp. 1_12]|uniref:diguanylate cyclase n=1 Tax=Paenibacillus sp. 1_12 TaxID=1566278 RepID=UPI0008EC91EB|nr:diguanylate cyclase [Paenibacillus sp. 1_12]SFL94604.1 PAS domain S-box-containing protein/diguanylate cyclase (GGDEF) domain-containing protein [Paenibacillus sp. 1_12]
MIQTLLSNLALLTTFLFFSSRLFKLKPTAHSSSMPNKVKVGIIHGLFGVILMFFSVSVSAQTMFDFRNNTIVVSAYFGGIYSALITTLIISTGRVLLFGGINPSSLMGTFNAFIISLLSVLLFQKVSGYWKAWLSSISVNIILAISSILLLVPAQSTEILPYFLPMMLASGLLAAYLIRFLEKSDQLLITVEQSEKRYRSLFTLYDTILHAAQDVAIIATDAKGVIHLFNTGAQRLFGYQSEELIGRHTPYLLHLPSEIQEYSEQLSRLHKHPIEGFDVLVDFAKHSDSQQKEWTYVRKDGSHLQVNMIVSSIRDHDHQITGYLGIGTDITEKKQAEEKLLEANRILHQLSMMDGLTEIANRRSFEENLEREWKRAERSSEALSLIMFDIDFFKLYNDTYGHLGGDFCLKRVASIAQKSLYRKPDFIARYGGEEFGIILPQTNAQDALLIAERIRKAVEAEAIQHKGSKGNNVVTISVGVATIIPYSHMDKDVLISKADRALYQAKQEGRNQVRSFT